MVAEHNLKIKTPSSHIFQISHAEDVLRTIYYLKVGEDFLMVVGHCALARQPQFTHIYGGCVECMNQATVSSTNRSLC